MWASISFSQVDENAIFEHYSIENGLSQNSVYSIIQDDNGFLWFGTLHGLNRFDGYNFDHFFSQPDDPLTISSNVVLSSLHLHNGKLLFGTYSGINIFDQRKEHFYRILLSNFDHGELSSDIIRILYQDNNKNIWAGTDNGLFCYNFDEKRILKYNLNDSAWSDEDAVFVRDIKQDRYGRIWIATYGGVFVLDEHRKIIQHFSEKTKKDAINSDAALSLLSSGKYMWVGTEAGLCKINVSDFSVKHYNEHHALNNEIIRSLNLDSDSLLWVGSNNGLFFYDENADVFHVFKHNPEQVNTISANKIFSLFEDNVGLVWIGTEGGGVNMLNKKRKNFKTLRHNPNGNPSLSSDVIWEIIQDRKRNIWIGTDRGVDVFVPGKDNIIHFSALEKHLKPNSSKMVKAIAEDHDGFIWIGTDDGLIEYDPDNNKFEKHIHDENDSNSLSDNIIRCLMVDSQNRVWIGTKNGGLNMYDKKNHRFVHYTFNENDSNSISNNRIWSLFEDFDGSIWIGTFGGGLNKMDLKEKKIYRYIHDPAQEFSISNNIVRDIYRDSRGLLWVATSYGLNLFHEQNHRFSVITALDGIANNLVYAILEDDQKRLWISTNNGLSLLDINQLEIRNYDENDGLQGNEFNQGAAVKCSNGSFFWGGINGITHFDPQSIEDNENIPEVAITQFNLFNKPVDISNDGTTPLNQSIIETHEIELQYYENSFSFKFTALNFINSNKNQYLYYLKGFDNDWIYAGDRRSAYYTNIDPGKYVFMVKGSNNDGVWSDRPATIVINIKPPFWQQTWFHILLIVIAILLLFAFIKIREKRHIREKRILEAKVTERTREIEQQKEEIRLQRDEIVKKNDNITDSIRYALRIQQALLPNEKSIKLSFPESFVLNIPKDIVSGDFYWMGQKAGKKYLAAVDCTGHGVPGAFMSIVSYNLLNEAISYLSDPKPAEVLNYLNQGIFASLRQQSEDTPVKDGMDLALCSFDENNSMLEYAGAYNPLMVISNGILTEIKADIRPIGDVVIGKEFNYTNHKIPLKKNDMVYIFSDGFVDQFGGTDKEKFMKKPFKKKLVDISDLPVSDQKSELESTFISWKANYNQIDDVLILGVRV